MNHDLERIGHAVLGHTTKPLTRKCDGGCGKEYDVHFLTLIYRGRSLWLCAECRAADMAQHPVMIREGPDLDNPRVWAADVISKPLKIEGDRKP